MIGIQQETKAVNTMEDRARDRRASDISHVLITAPSEGRGDMAEARFEEITAENFTKAMKDIVVPQTRNPTNPKQDT